MGIWNFTDKIVDAIDKTSEKMVDVADRAGKKSAEKSFEFGGKIAQDILDWINKEHKRTGVPQETIYKLHIRDDSICQLTGHKIAKDLREVDHIVPKSKGGTNALLNLQILCRHHNRQKQDKSWSNFRAEWKDDKTPCG